MERLTRIARQVETSGAAWISVAKLAGRPALRACITSYRTTQSDIDALGDALIDAASWYANESHPSNTDPP
jgi:hypothetical protein